MTANVGLPARLQTLIDQHTVIDLCNRYALALDERDWAALENCFMPDAVFHRPTGEPLVGFAAILARSRGALDCLDASQHLIGSHVVEVNGDQANSTCYFHAQHVRAGAIGGSLFVIAGSYRDDLRRTSDGWRIFERKQDVSWRSGNAGVIVR